MSTIKSSLISEIRRVRRLLGASEGSGAEEEVDDEWVQDALIDNAYEEYDSTTAAYVTRHDRYGAAADILEELSARHKALVDVKDSVQSLSLSQTYKQYMNLAAHYRSRARIKIITAERDDLYY